MDSPGRGSSLGGGIVACLRVMLWRGGPWDVTQDARDEMVPENRHALLDDDATRLHFRLPILS
jgi:hypothetical protein